MDTTNNVPHPDSVLGLIVHVIVVGDHADWQAAHEHGDGERAQHPVSRGAAAAVALAPALAQALALLTDRQLALATVVRAPLCGGT